MASKSNIKGLPLGPVADEDTPATEPPHGVKKKLAGGRLIRIILGSSILLIAGWVFIPDLLFPISSNAVVNAHVITLRAPIEGDVLSITATTGGTVAKDEILIRLGNNRVDDTQLSALRAQRATLLEKIAALEQELAELQRISQRLKTSSGEYREAIGERYVALLAEANARLTARRAIAEEAAANLQRQQTLYIKRLSTLAALEAAQRSETVALADLREAERAVERVKVEKDSAAQGIYFGDGYNNVPYTQQRGDEILLRVQALRSELRDSQIRLKETERQATVEQQRLERRNYAELAAPAAGRLWLQLAANGEYVTAGAPLLQILDTSRLFLMVSLDERHFDDIAVGDDAVVDLVASQKSIHGTVERVQGNEAKLDDSVLAVAAPPIKPREFLVVVNLDKSKFADETEIFNQVGRRAKVSFHKSAATASP
ncbi:MAG: HlyD family efflux transporter periplasmic adaptor subunit [Pseudomonadota bacterium]